MLKDGPITACTSSKVRPIKFELRKDCLSIGDGDWWGKRRDRAAVETCGVCRRELRRSRDRARPLLQRGRWGNRRRRGRTSTQCWWDGVSPLYYLARLDAFVCWSLRCLCDRVESHGRRSLLLCPSTYTPLLPRGGQCVRACNHSPQQDQHQTTISSSAAASSPCILALALACSSGQTPYLQLAGRLSLQISHTSSSTASTIPPCTEM